MLASAAIVASMVASILLRPAGDQVLARDGYSNRDFYASNLVGVVLGTGPRFPARAVEPRPIRATASRTWQPGGALARSEREAGTHLAALRSPQPTSSSVCVRLCDGYYFPIGTVRRAGDIATHTAVCSSACPGAPAALPAPLRGQRDRPCGGRDQRAFLRRPARRLRPHDRHRSHLRLSCGGLGRCRSPLASRGHHDAPGRQHHDFRGLARVPGRRPLALSPGRFRHGGRCGPALADPIHPDRDGECQPASATLAPLRSADLKIQVSLSPDAGALARPAKTTVADQR